MKWFKHMTTSSDDEGIAELEDLFGLEGYARWFKLLEAVGKQMDETGKCSASYSWRRWQVILKGKRKKLETFLEHCQNKLGINLKQNGNILEIEVPNLLKFRDNHTKNLQASSKGTCKQEVEVEVEVEKDGADAPTIWDLGEQIFGNRAYVTKLIKASGEESVVQAIAKLAAMKNPPNDPKSYVRGMLKATNNDDFFAGAL